MDFIVNGYKMKNINYLLPLVLVVSFGFSCAAYRKGDAIHVQEYEGFSGYTVYVRDVEPSPVSTYIINKPEIEPSENIKSEEKHDRPYSSLYYYRSSNPHRLTRIRLRRFY